MSTRDSVLKLSEKENMTTEERKEYAIKQSETRSPRSQYKKTNNEKTGYLTDENVVAVHTAVMRKGFTKIGRPTCFQDVDKLTDEISEYFELCASRKVMPLVAGLCNWLGVSYDTVADHAKNPNSPFYQPLKYALALTNELSQGAMVNGKLNPMAYMFLAGNYWGLHDVRQVNIQSGAISSAQSPAEREDTINALKEEILKEEQSELKATIIEADFETSD